MIKKATITNFELRKSFCVPKYIQIAESITNDILKGKITRDERIPSINALSEKNGVSRDTIEKAYKVLRERNLIFSVSGVGNFVNSNIVGLLPKVVFLINKSSSYKIDVFNAFANSIGKAAFVNMYLYNCDEDLFVDFLKKNFSNYNYFVIMPHFRDENEGHVNYTPNVIKEIEKISKNKLIILDNSPYEISGKFTAIYQDYRKDIFFALQSGFQKIKGYKKIFLIYPEKSFFPCPKGVLIGFIDFCERYQFDFEILEEIQNELQFEDKEIYITINDNDLVYLMQQIREKSKVLGRDVGIISYNDTPLKALLGITVMTTDFKGMGESAAHCILNNKIEVFKNPFHYIERNSL